MRIIIFSTCSFYLQYFVKKNFVKPPRSSLCLPAWLTTTLFRLYLFNFIAFTFTIEENIVYLIIFFRTSFPFWTNTFCHSSKSKKKAFSNQKVPLRWLVKRSAKNKIKDANLPTFEKTNLVVTIFKTFYFNFFIKSVVPLKERQCKNLIRDKCFVPTAEKASSIDKGNLLFR